MARSRLVGMEDFHVNVTMRTGPPSKAKEEPTMLNAKPFLLKLFSS